MLKFKLEKIKFQKYLKPKERIMETQIFHHIQNKLKKQNLQKTFQRETKILQDIIIITRQTNLKFQHKPKKYHLSKILI
jgi:hypothetical protein